MLRSDDPVDIEESCRTRVSTSCRSGGTRLAILSRSGVGAAFLFFVGICWCATSSSTDEGKSASAAHELAQPQTIAVAISPDGKTLATAQTDQQVTLRALEAGTTIVRLFETTEHAWAVAFAPSGRWLAMGGIGHDIIACDLRKSGRERPLGIPIHGTSVLEISLDEQTLVAANNVTGDIVVWDLVRGGARMRLRGHPWSSRAIALSADGQSLAWADRWKPLIEVWDLRAGRRKLALATTDFCQALAFSADGSLIAGAGLNRHRLKAWDTSTGHERRVLDPEIVAGRAIAFSADGRLLATCGHDSRIRVWELATGCERLTLPTKSPAVLDLRFSRDSSTLAACESPSGVELWHLTALLKAQLASRATRAQRAPERDLGSVQCRFADKIVDRPDNALVEPRFQPAGGCSREGILPTGVSSPGNGF
jgi:WD40 repeat protein